MSAKAGVASAQERVPGVTPCACVTLSGALGVFLMHISSSGNEKGAHLCAVQTDSKLQRCLIVVVFGMHISTSVEEKWTHCRLVENNSIVKRCAPSFVQRIGVSPSVEE
eukprot:Rhum_TRINITY_DN15016_c0_g4::Rhum_TRINITY_DN15016_c0_g4_i1::g.133456::m.133456